MEKLLYFPTTLLRSDNQKHECEEGFWLSFYTCIFISFHKQTPRWHKIITINKPLIFVWSWDRGFPNLKFSFPNNFLKTNKVCHNSWSSFHWNIMQRFISQKIVYMYSTHQPQINTPKNTQFFGQTTNI